MFHWIHMYLVVLFKGMVKIDPVQFYREDDKTLQSQAQLRSLTHI
jgi:hypothetical protein